MPPLACSVWTRISTALSLSLLAAVAQAATVVWSPTPVNGNWSNGANWEGGMPPQPGDDLLFPETSTIQSTTNDLADGVSINSITFNGNGYVLAGNSISLGVAGILALLVPRPEVTRLALRSRSPSACQQNWL